MQGREKAQSQLFGTTPIVDVLSADHPLRKIRADFDAVFGRLADAFETNYGTTGNVSIPSVVLLRAWLLKALYSIKSERALCEQIEMNAGFRWFVGLDWDDKVFDHSTLSSNRGRLFGSGAAEALLGEVVRLAATRRLLVSDRMVVDGTLVKAWASHKNSVQGVRTTFAWDPNGNQTQSNAFSVGLTTFGYDAIDRIVRRTDPVGISQGYSYDSADQRIKLIAPDGGVRSMTYDLAARVNFTLMPTGFGFTSVYDAASRVVSEMYVSGTVRNTFYDHAGQVVGHSDLSGTGATLARWTFGYDPVGNRQTVGDYQGNLTTYLMDPKNRLIADQTTGPNAHGYTYSYDPVDNRLTSSETGFVTSWTYDLTSRMQTALTNTRLSSYTYMTDGNLQIVLDPGAFTTMGYDTENRLATHQSSAGQTNYLYYADNMKAIENVNGTITKLIWDGTDYLQGRS